MKANPHLGVEILGNNPLVKPPASSALPKSAQKTGRDPEPGKFLRVGWVYLEASKAKAGTDEGP